MVRSLARSAPYVAGLRLPDLCILFVLVVIQMVQAITGRIGALRAVPELQRRVSFFRPVTDGAAMKRLLLGYGYRLLFHLSVAPAYHQKQVLAEE